MSRSHGKESEASHRSPDKPSKPFQGRKGPTLPDSPGMAERRFTGLVWKGQI